MIIVLLHIKCEKNHKKRRVQNSVTRYVKKYSHIFLILTSESKEILSKIYLTYKKSQNRMVIDGE